MKTKKLIPIPLPTLFLFLEVPLLESPTTGDQLSKVIDRLQPIAKSESAAFSLLRELDSYRCYGE